MLFSFLTLSYSKKEDDYNSADECDVSKIINNTNEVEGYADKVSYYAGEAVSLVGIYGLWI